MKRNTLNFVIDTAAAMVMSGLIATGLVIRFVLPPGSGSRRELWGLGRHDWGDIHFQMAVAVGAVVILHVALHWQWVCVITLRCLPGRTEGRTPPTPLRRNLTGVAFVALLVGLFGGFVWVASARVQDVRGGAEGHVPDSAARAGPIGPGKDAARGSDQGESLSIRGSMTLKEAADACGITVQTARARLGLPPDVSDDQRLGRLSAQHGFSMSQARTKLTAQSGP